MATKTNSQYTTHGDTIQTFINPPGKGHGEQTL
jgi:hypothetical protein